MLYLYVKIYIIFYFVDIYSFHFKFLHEYQITLSGSKFITFNCDY